MTTHGFSGSETYRPRVQPPVHLAVGYLCYAAYSRRRFGRPPGQLATLGALAGAALPDLLDKPLAAAGVVPVGRTIGHSLLFVLPLAAGVWIAARARDRPEIGVAVAVGILTHVATDVPWHVLAGTYAELGFLLWPITPMPAYTGVKPLATVGGYEVTTLWLEAPVFLAGVTLWWHDGRPGATALGKRVRNVRS